MADTLVDLTKQTKLPSQIAAAIAAQSDPSNALNAAPIVYAGDPSSPTPSVVKDAMSVPKTFINPKDDSNAISPDTIVPGSVDASVPDPIKAAMSSKPDVVPPSNVPPPAPIMDALSSSKTADESSLAAAPPKVDLHQTLGQKVVSHVPQIIAGLGAVGGAMEAAGSPGHEAPNAARLQAAEEAVANRALTSKKLDIEQQQADTNEGYRAEAAKQYGLSPVEMPDPNNPGKTTTVYVQNKDMGKYAGAAVTAGSKEKVATTQQTGAYQRELLKQGAPMNVDPELAQLAGQPQLAGKAINGTTLQNFIKTLSARGIHIQDLGDEGLWSIDKAGNRIKQVSVTSPSLTRAVAGRQAGVVDVYDNDGNLIPMTDAQRLKAGLPKASTEFGEQGPTVDMRNKAAIADRAAQAGNRVLQDLQDPKIRALIGAAMGKAANWENFLGILPPELGETTQDLKSFSQFVGGQHPVRGLNALEAFEKSIGGIGQNPDTLAAKIQAQMKTSDFISNAGKFKPKRGPGGNGNGTADKPIVTPAGGGPPQTHNFSLSAWQKANPGGDANAAKAAAVAQGYVVTN